MAFAPMSYKDYVWPYNPENIKIERAKSIGAFTVPYAGSIVQALGEKGRTVTGGGRFTGKNCAGEFKKLAAVFSLSGPGKLSLPGAEPFTAVFSSLTVKGAAKPDCIAYEFVFLEDFSLQEEKETDIAGGTYICKGGENLWDIAAEYGTEVDRLVGLNRWIEWPCGLEKGERVLLP